MLDVVATTLEHLVRDVVDAMNTGASLDSIQQTVDVDSSLLELPYLRPLYDEPEFAIRNIWRLYGGFLIVILNLLSDIVQAYLNPRLRESL